MVGEEAGQRCGLGEVQPQPGCTGFFGLRIVPRLLTTWKQGSEPLTPTLLGRGFGPLLCKGWGNLPVLQVQGFV